MAVDRGASTDDGVSEDPVEAPKAEAPAGRPARAGWGRILRGVLPFVGLGAALVLLYFLVDVEQVGRALLRADPVWLAACAGLALNATVIVGLKLWCVVRIVELPRGFRDTWSAVMAGLSLNAVLPGRGGELLRAVFLAREPGSFTVLLGAVFVERLIDVGTLGGLVLLTGVALDWITALAVGVVGAAVVGTVVLAWLGPRSPIRSDLGARLARTATRAVARWPWTLAAMALSLAAWANNALLFLCAMRAVGVTIPTATALRGIAVSILAGIVPVTISGIGTRDTTLVLMLRSFGQDDALAAAGLLYTAFIYWFLAALGAVVLGPQTLRTVRRLAAAYRRDGASDEAG